MNVLYFVGHFDSTDGILFQLTSYGGYLEFILRHIPTPGSEPTVGSPLIEIQVNPYIFLLQEIQVNPYIFLLQAQNLL